LGPFESRIAHPYERELEISEERRVQNDVIRVHEERKWKKRRSSGEQKNPGVPLRTSGAKKQMSALHHHAKEKHPGSQQPIVVSQAQPIVVRMSETTRQILYQFFRGVCSVTQ
jgi:hypothetical protein